MIRINLPVHIEDLIEKMTEFDFVILCRFAIGAEESIAGSSQFRMSLDEVIEDVRHIPGDVQSHFHLIGYLHELFENDFLVVGQNLSNSFRTVCNNAKAHGQRSDRFQKVSQNTLVSRKVSTLRADLPVADVADCC